MRCICFILRCLDGVFCRMSRFLHRHEAYWQYWHCAIGKNLVDNISLAYAAVWMILQFRIIHDMLILRNWCYTELQLLVMLLLVLFLQIVFVIYVLLYFSAFQTMTWTISTDVFSLKQFVSINQRTFCSSSKWPPWMLGRPLGIRHRPASWLKSHFSSFYAKRFRARLWSTTVPSAWQVGNPQWKNDCGVFTQCTPRNDAPFNFLLKRIWRSHFSF